MRRSILFVSILCFGLSVFSQETDLEILRRRLQQDVQGSGAGRGSSVLAQEAKRKWEQQEAEINAQIEIQERARAEGGDKLRETIAMFESRAAMQDRPVDHYLAGRILGQSMKLEEARVHFERAITQDPFFYWAYHGLGTYFNNREMYEPAIARYERALELNPNFLNSARGMALCQMRLGRKADAEATLRSVLEQSPNDQEGLWFLAILMTDQGLHQEASLYLERLATIKPGAPEVEAALANAYRRTDRIPEAVAIYERLIASDPSEWKSCLTMADITQRQGQNHVAATWLEKALSRLPANASIAPDRLQEMIVDLKSRPAAEAIDPNRRSPEEWVDILLNSVEVDRRREAARIVGSSPYMNKVMMDGLLKALRDKDPDVKTIALKSLAQNWPPEERPALVSMLGLLLKDRSPLVRGMAAFVLGREIKARAGVPHLINALGDQDPYSFRQIHEALNHLTFAYIGVHLPTDLSMSERQRLATEWREWFDRNREDYRSAEDSGR